MGNGWHSFFLKARRERERARAVHTHSHTAAQTRGRRGRGSEQEAEQSPQLAVPAAGSMSTLSMATWGLYLQLLSCWAFSQSPYADDAFSLSAGKSLYVSLLCLLRTRALLLALPSNWEHRSDNLPCRSGTYLLLGGFCFIISGFMPFPSWWEITERSPSRDKMPFFPLVWCCTNGCCQRTWPI